MFGEPEVDVIEEVEARPIDQPVAGRLLFRTEEDRRGKDTLEALHHAAIIAAVLGEPEELQHLSGACEMHGAALLPEGKGSNPDGYEAVLAKGQTEVGMADNVKEEPSVAPSMNELVPWHWTQRNAAEDKRPGVERNFLFALLTLFSNHQDRVDLLGSSGRDAYVRQD